MNRCLNCGRGMVSRRHARRFGVPDGLTRHDGNGLCSCCAVRRRRGKPMLAPIRTGARRRGAA